VEVDKETFGKGASDEFPKVLLEKGRVARVGMEEGVD
jgi:hypothetical protein